jgi:hypothetical protein
MIRPTSCILLLLAAGAGAALFHISFDVSALDDRLTALNRGIVADQEALHVLRAEWAFLNQPARIEELSQRYLDLQPLDGAQIGTASLLAFRPPAPGDPVPGVDAPDGTTAFAALNPPPAGQPRLKPQAPQHYAATVPVPATAPSPIPVSMSSDVQEDSVSTMGIPTVAEPPAQHSPLAPGGGAIPIAGRSLDDVLADLTRMGGER